MSPLRIEYKGGTLEALKWFALVLMTGDHINKFFFKDKIEVVFAAGRLVMPIFFFILAYNLARPGARERGVFQRVMFRLLIAGGIASIPFLKLGGLVLGWWPLNIMFTLFVVTLTIYLFEGGRWFLAMLVFSFGCCFVEYWWFAGVFSIAVWSYFKKPSWLAALIALVACISFRIVNGNDWAIAALPLILLASRFEIKIPRVRNFFYVYYPLHLFVLFFIIYLK